MRVTLMVIPHKVKPLVPEWKGWRIIQYGFVWKEPCECDAVKGCIAAAYLDDEEPCECSERPPHTHTWAGNLGSRPIFFPKTGKVKDVR